MTDLHTHILPAMDDGAKTAEESIRLLRMEARQGVDAVVLTPHFYCDRERPAEFLRRRQRAMDALAEELDRLDAAERQQLPRLRLGAEVLWRPDMAEWEELPLLCMEGTQNLLLELPFTPWSDHMIRRIYDLMGRTGILPVIAHLERYLKIQRPERIREVLDMGVPVQISSGALLRLMGRGGALKLLRQQRAHLIASDCHNETDRAPDLGAAMQVAEKKLGAARAEELLRCAGELAGL